ncbi:HD domain-containing protein [Paenibacillus larvae]
MKKPLQTLSEPDLWEPLYQLEVRPDALERELFQSRPLRRLKHLHHYGAGALISPLIHSRLEHTIGVWVLAKTFFPEWRELHVAAILHDIGHLPFSHAVERALGYDHHQNTEQAILSPQVALVLKKYGLSPYKIVHLLNEYTPLTNASNKLGLDHLDSFLRDTQAAGFSNIHPSELISRLRFKGPYIEADEEIAIHIMDAVLNENLLFLNPYFLGVNAVLSEAVHLYSVQRPELGEKIAGMADHELLVKLESAESAAVRKLVQVLLWEPHRIVECDPDTPGSIRTEIRKIYDKQPLVGNLEVSDIRSDVHARLQELEALRGTYHFHIYP